MSIEHYKWNMDRQTNLLIEILVQEKTLLEDRVGELENGLKQIKSQMIDLSGNNQIIIEGIDKLLNEQK
jgi:hypothetical protein